MMIIEIKKNQIRNEISDKSQLLDYLYSNSPYNRLTSEN